MKYKAAEVFACLKMGSTRRMSFQDGWAWILAHMFQIKRRGRGDMTSNKITSAFPRRALIVIFLFSGFHLHLIEPSGHNIGVEWLTLI